MEQQYIPEPVQEEPEQQEQVYRLKFAEDYYELPEMPVYKKPKKVRKAREKKQRNHLPTFVWVILVILAVVISTVVTSVMLDQMWQVRFDQFSRSMMAENADLQEQIEEFSKQDNNLISAQVAPDGLLTPGQVYAQNWESVVAISAYRKATSALGQSGTYRSLGSGFFISGDGYVVSNYHVVEGAEQIQVTTADAEVHEATLVGFDKINDVSLLKIDGQDFPYAKPGSSTSLQVGDQVVAIGNPLGNLTSTMTVGYVSAKDRIVDTDGSTINMLQTDAAINSGNSGGPLFNMKGEVVGIITAKFSGLSSSGASIEGIGFAIPMDDVIGMLDDLWELGYYAGAYLGVMVMDVDPAAQTYGLPAGAFVDEVIPGYGAEAAGMLAQDIIVQLGEYKITSREELTRMLRKFEPGQTVSVTVYRAGKEVELQVLLDKKPNTEADSEPQDQTQPQTQQPEQQPSQQYPMPGMVNIEDWFQDFMKDFFG